ncbi:MAG: type III-B CRISPR module RAMP protein Cmr4 [Gammaproteobacteria bacterium]|nr:type III-B CRISPR module RAMP protein Cmr4 [Gammaproteobacteria bacterium]
MFESSKLVFYYAISPVHMGAGSALGAIDNPIQREVHTSLPMFAGSGLKGAVRHACRAAWHGRDDGAELVNGLFGPESSDRLHAGAVSFADAQLVVLPVRSLRGAFAFVASPLTLGRLARLADLAGEPDPWRIPAVEAGAANCATKGLLSGQQLVLEAFEFGAIVDPEVSAIAQWLSSRVLPADSAHTFFAAKLARDLVVVDDASLCHFARHAMVVESHVGISDETGTAEDGRLFFTENLPAETVMAGLVQSTRERVLDKAQPRDAHAVMETLLSGPQGGSGIAKSVLQIGADATTGRGLVVVNV